MNLKDFTKNLFKYTPQSDYDFSISKKNTDSNISDIDATQDKHNKNSKGQNIFSSLTINKENIQSIYNIFINSDIIIRDFTLTARGKQYDAFLLYIDGMVDVKAISDFILESLMLKNKSNTFAGNENKVVREALSDNITIRKIKKFDLADYIYNSLIPENSVTKCSTFEEIVSSVNSGNCALFVDTLSIAFDIDVKGFKQRSIDAPNNEVIIKGPQEAFVENIRTNTSQIRRIMNNENLIIENLTVGNISQTKCAVCYMQNITNTDLVAEVKYRINNLAVDTLLSSGQLEQLIEDNSRYGIPQILSTERPDKCTKHLMQGRVVVLVNGSPYGLIMPATLIDYIASPEDTNIKPVFANFLKILRLIAGLITLLLPGSYVALTSFHQEILPTELLFSILAARQYVPFPIIVEILIMELSFELIREAGLRVPSPVGPTIGIVGALILGEAAVNANIVSPILIIIVAITAISSFAIPDYSFSFHLRIYRFFFILLGFISGFLGIGFGIFIYVLVLCSLRSFGVPYTVPFVPSSKTKGVGYLIPPIWKQEQRADYLATKKEKAQEKISMKWKYENK